MTKWLAMSALLIGIGCGVPETPTQGPAQVEETSVQHFCQVDANGIETGLCVYPAAPLCCYATRTTGCVKGRAGTGITTTCDRIDTNVCTGSGFVC